MRRLMLAAGAAALAISMPAMAKPDNAGGGKGGKGGQAAQVERGGGQARAAKADRGPQARVQKLERRGGGDRRQFAIERRGGGELRFAARQERGGKAREQRLETRGAAKVAKARDRAAERQFKAERKFVDRQSKSERKLVDRQIKAENRFIDQRNKQFERMSGRGAARTADFDRDFDEDRWVRIFGDRGVPAHWAFNCPPGLAKKTPSCIPPGQAKNLGLVGSMLPAAYASNLLPLGLRDLYRDDDDYLYRWGDGYVYRVDRDTQLVSALLPLIGAGLGIGMPFPYSGSSYQVPSAYQPFYPSYGDDYYRYANGYAYEIDGRTGLIENVVPLLDHGYGVGQMLPAGYSYYNVPYQYRDLYYDTPEYAYRYAPGAIYQVDPSTQLITAVASLLTGGLSVGQPLPQAYSAYNVPLGYRDMYYDRPDAWYRYSDGYIYQVDPTTQLITAIVRAIV